MINFAIGIHNHQPVGNFDSVFHDAVEKAYLPFLEILFRHPGIKLSIHNCGILYDWFDKHDSRYPDMLRELVGRGQVELMTGGFYEPILPSIPERDGVGQIRMLSSYIENKFGTTPTGYWTAERVWEPHLPRILSRAGVKYTLLDDYHFKAAGLSENELTGYYLTEDDGSIVSVFPISKELRYMIPFKQVDELISYLRELSETRSGSLTVFGDDGEKFGVWPGTYQWVIEEGWLDRFFTELENNSSWIRMLTFSEALEVSRPVGIVYLPTASYHEMMEWSLFDNARLAFHQVEEDLKATGMFDRLDAYAFLRGGLWRNFLAKYPESNAMHKKMMRVSRRIEDVSQTVSADTAAILQNAREKLWAGQCNCPYWHGVFGGLYLPHLRSANYGSLLEAENIVEGLLSKGGEVRLDRCDFDGDGNEEVILESRDINVYVSPAFGGGLMELDYRPLCMNLMDTMRRKVEPYLLIPPSADSVDEAGCDEAIPSIHEIAKKSKLDPADMVTDPLKKRSFIDRFITNDVTFENYQLGRFDDLGDFAYGPFETKSAISGSRLSLECSRESSLDINGRLYPFKIGKTYEIVNGEGCLNILLKLTDQGSLDFGARYGIEFSIGEIPGNTEDRYMRFMPSGTRKLLGESGEETGIDSFVIRDGWKDLTVDLTFSRTVTLWHYPIETLSQSEGGFEKIYQGTTFIALIPIGPPGPKKRSLKMNIRFRGGAGS